MAKHPNALRKCIQAGWGILTNAYMKGFLPGAPYIYGGNLKQVCVPGMNCYSCPGALGSCPIGSMQAVFDGRQREFAFYVVGYLALIGLVVGRFICGWLCLFGLIQELLYKIPTPKLTIPTKVDRPLRYLKYLILIVMVFILPFFIRSQYGVGAPFCKYICPLGAFYGLFQKISLIRMRVDEDACVNCGKCARTCKMNVDPHTTPNSNECIRCRECVNACPMHALSMGIGSLKNNTVRKQEESL